MTRPSARHSPALAALTAAIAARLREAVAPDMPAAVGARIGLGSHTVRRYLRGESLPPLPFLLAVSRAYGISLEWLATGRGMRREEDYVRAMLATASVSELAHAIEDRLTAIRELDPASDCSSASCPLATTLDVRVRTRHAAIL